MNVNTGMYTNVEVDSAASKDAHSCGNMPIYECPCERVVHREICHEVPHIVPINTKIINHHIYKHTYTPCYTCTEENEVCNITEGCPKF